MVDALGKENVQIKLFDNTGKLLMQQTQVVYEGRTPVAVNSSLYLPNGVYMVQMVTSGGVYPARLIVNR